MPPARIIRGRRDTGDHMRLLEKFFLRAARVVARVRNEFRRGLHETGKDCVLFF